MLSKKTKMLRLSALSLAVAGAMSFSHAANAEGVDVSGSVGVANMYLWRGFDLGAGMGAGAISGDLNVSASGAYAGVWGSSGDNTFGTEYDLYVGYGAEFGGVTIDVSLWNYMYPSEPEPTIDDDFGGLSDAVVSLGFAGFTATAYDNIAGSSGYEYYTLSYSYDAFSVLVGRHDGGFDKMVHVNLTYAYNDNLSFTFSQQVDSENETEDDDLKFVVSYSLPIGE